ncbi:hypothetical protein B0J14DRAFT_697995 [Halenospora varia]|nr:hypothetical protein B0J14DRAFT_697995 [Halenospora varia]
MPLLQPKDYSGGPDNRPLSATESTPQYPPRNNDNFAVRKPYGRHSRSQSMPIDQIETLDPGAGTKDSGGQWDFLETAQWNTPGDLQPSNGQPNRNKVREGEQNRRRTLQAAPSTSDPAERVSENGTNDAYTHEEDDAPSTDGQSESTIQQTADRGPTAQNQEVEDKIKAIGEVRDPVEGIIHRSSSLSQPAFLKEWDDHRNVVRRGYLENHKWSFGNDGIISLTWSVKGGLKTTPANFIVSESIPIDFFISKASSSELDNYHARKQQGTPSSPRKAHDGPALHQYPPKLELHQYPSKLECFFLVIVCVLIISTGACHLFKEISDPNFLLHVKSIVFVIVCIALAMLLELVGVLLHYRKLGKHAFAWVVAWYSEGIKGNAV